MVRPSSGVFYDSAGWGWANFRTLSQPLVARLRACGSSLGNGKAVLENSPRLPVCGLPGVFGNAPPTPKEVVASKACALCIEEV
jgi:hypothetical protein